MGNPDTRTKLIKATKQLLTDGTQIDALTSRQISVVAGTNLAMINYCFKSKDELLKIAVGEILEEEFSRHSNIDEPNKTAKEQLRALLFHICAAVVKYKSLTKLSIPYLLLHDEISLPNDILPYIKKHYDGKRSETECKMIAFQLVYTLQLIFYRSVEFYKYSGIDIEAKDNLLLCLDMQLNILLGEGL